MQELEPFLDERFKRVWVAAEARALGRGGINAVRSAIGILTMMVDSGGNSYRTRL